VNGPLGGVRVIDLGTRIAAPFCAALLGELGADVIKVEDPGTGDMLRSVGAFVDGKSLFWAVEGRGKRSVTCDLRSPQGQALLRQLLSTADVVVENFRPGTLERWNLAPEQLDPSLVFVRISVFGQSGPAAARPGLDIVALAASGMLALSGYPDGPPMKSGITIADHLTAVFAAQAAIAALVERRRTGVGAVIDAPLHASVLRVLEWTVAAQDRLGIVRERTGDRGPHDYPSGVRRASDGRFVALVVEGDTQRSALNTLTGDDVDAWISQRSALAAVEELTAVGIPAAVVQTTEDLVRSRDQNAADFITVDDSELGPLLQQAPFPRFESMPSPVVAPAPLLGQHNDEVWGAEFNVSDAELAELRAAGVI
jgi:crotonobetainyl-CoA:carnitine CoA-transferase CaiB-like acyl-CoA transferase